MELGDTAVDPCLGVAKFKHINTFHEHVHSFALDDAATLFFLLFLRGNFLRCNFVTVAVRLGDDVLVVEVGLHELSEEVEAEKAHF